MEKRIIFTIMLSSVESKSEFMVWNTHSLTTKKGSSRDILINFNTPFPSAKTRALSSEMRSHRNSRNNLNFHRSKSLSVFNCGRCHQEGGCVSNCSSSNVAAALRWTILTEVFPRNQLILDNGEVVHDYHKRKKLTKLRMCDIALD